MRDAVRDKCFFGCAVEEGCLEHCVRCVPLRMTIGLFDEVDPGTSIVDFYPIGHSSDVTSHTAGFRRL